jgi:hypothetical protein
VAQSYGRDILAISQANLSVLSILLRMNMKEISPVTKGFSISIHGLITPDPE